MRVVLERFSRTRDVNICSAERSVLLAKKREAEQKNYSVCISLVPKPFSEPGFGLEKVVFLFEIECFFSSEIEKEW